MFKKSIAMRMISAIALMLVVGIGLLIFVQSNLTSNFFAEEFKNNYEEKTILFAEQMGGGIKWKKANSIESVYAREADPSRESNLIDVLVTDSNLDPLVTYSHEKFEKIDLAPLLNEHKDALSDKHHVTYNEKDAVITLVRSFDEKKGEIIGYIAMAWSKESSLKMLASMRNTSLITSMAMTLSFILALIFMLQKMTINPIKSLQHTMQELANGNNKIAIPYSEKEDEIGAMAHSINIFKENAIKKDLLEAEQHEIAKRSEIEKQKSMEELANSFNAQVGGLIESIADSARQLHGTAGNMKSIADVTSHSSQNVAMSSEEASTNVNTVASAMEEMSASAAEIGTQIVGVKNKSNDASDNAQDANKTVSDLSNLVENIGQVVIAIQGIAEQTNLLALNATIEAARAGEAGKGFAVVADEVKKLANETASKTSEINAQITGIQDATQRSVIAMERIITNISDIDYSMTGVSAAVEEQNATTAEIVRSISEASSGVEKVAEIITDVQRAANDTGESADSVLNASNEVLQLSDNLKLSVQTFLKNLQG